MEKKVTGLGRGSLCFGTNKFTIRDWETEEEYLIRDAKGESTKSLIFYFVKFVVLRRLVQRNKFL